MYYYLSGDVRILLDGVEWCVRVEQLQSLIPGFRPRWVRTCSFASQAEWAQSQFAGLANDDVQESLAWFWVDRWDEAHSQAKG